MNRASRSRRTAPSVWLIDLACLAFAAWVVVCQAVVNLGGNVFHLRVSVFVLLVASLGCGLWWGRRRGPRGLARAMLDAEVLPHTPAPTGTSRAGRLIPWVVGLSGLTALLVYAYTDREAWLAWLSVAPCALALVWSLLGTRSGVRRQAPEPPAPAPAQVPAPERWLSVLSLACVLFTLCARRPDTDDAFYLSVASAMLRAPEAAIMGGDPVHGMPAWPLQLAVYRAHTLEVLAGLLSGLTGLRPIVWLHLVFAGISAALVPFVWMRLFRELLPGRALVCVCLTLVWLLADGGTNQSYGNFAMVRLFQGKAIMLTLVVPAVLAYGIRFAVAPSRLRFMLLLSAQIAGVGLSSIGIPLMPLLAGIGLLAGADFRRLRRVGAGMLASLYPLGLGAFYHAKMRVRSVPGLPELVDRAAAASTVGGTSGDAGELLATTYSRVLSEAPCRWVYLAALLLLPALGHTVVVRRLAAGAGLVFFAVLANPLTEPIIAGHVFGPSTYWRIFWLLPLPAFVAATGISTERLWSGRIPPAAGVAVGAVLVLLLAAVTPKRPVFAPENRIAFGWPAVKVDNFYPLAKRASRAAPPGSTVAAHPRVGVWFGAFDKPVYPVYVKRSYLKRRARGLRESLLRCIVFQVPGCSQRFMRAQLERLHVGAVVLESRWPGRRTARRSVRRRVRRVLRTLSFKRVGRGAGREIWARPSVPGRPVLP